MAKYDDASWHYLGSYPEGMPKENAATHIGMFLAWCINNKFISEDQLEDSAEDIEKVKARQLTGAGFLMRNCDGKFTDEDLDEIGNGFARDYYQYSEGNNFQNLYADYLSDYARVLNNSSIGTDLYNVADSWENYDLLKVVIRQRFKEWSNYLLKK